MGTSAIIRRFERIDYESCWAAMKAFTEARGRHTADEFWVLEHPGVFTLGQAGRREHILAAGNIPVVNSDRGGQVTYHGPGQTVIYPLLDLRRHRIGARELVSRVENAVIAMLDNEGIDAVTHAGAPGVYVDGAKIASVGLRIRRGCSYHGLALNRELDLEDSFGRINPCGYAGQAVTSLARLGADSTRTRVEDGLLTALAEAFGVNGWTQASGLPECYTEFVNYFTQESS
jgi:lipoyl(octanoyl) transferase